MKKLIAILFILCGFNSCSDSDSVLYEAPTVRSYATYISQNSATLNGFIDHSNRYFRDPDTFNVGFIFRAGDEEDASNDVIIELGEGVEYYTGTYYFSHDIDQLEPNTTYYYTAYTINGSTGKDNWNSFTTSSIPCTYEKDNYYNVSGIWKSASVEITDPICCDEGNVGFRFGTWPNIYEINFNELNSGYPKTGRYFGVNYGFDTTHIERELVKSSNQVLIGNKTTPATELFITNNGERITLIFCNTILRNGDVLNGKVSVEIP